MAVDPCPTQRLSVPISRDTAIPEGPARHPDVSRQKLTRHCLATIFDSQLPSPKLSLKMLPNCLFPHKRGLFSSFKIAPAVRVTARQLRDKNCLATIFAPRHQGVSFGPLGYYRCDTPYRAILFQGILHSPTMLRYPPWYLVSHRHLCAIPLLQHIARELCDTPTKTSTKYFCDTIAACIARFAIGPLAQRTLPY